MSQKFGSSSSIRSKIRAIGQMLALVLAMSAAQEARAQTIWDGGGADDNWGTAANWDNDMAPANDTALTFGDAMAARLTNSNNTLTDVNSITFANQAGYVLSGNALNLNAAGFIDNNFDGTNTYSIATTMEGAASSASVATGANALVFGATITNGGFDLTLTGAGNHTFNAAGLYAGAGGLVKNSTGTLLVSSNSNGFTGTANLNAGTTQIDGTLGDAATSTVNVNMGATLVGAGAVGGSLVNVAGTISPGVNSIATLTVGRDFTMNGGTLAMSLNADGTRDQVDAANTATVNGGTLALTAQADQQGSYVGQTFHVIRAQNGTAGAFGTVTDNLALLDATVSLIQNVDGTTNDVFAVTFNTNGAALESLAQPGNTNQLAVVRDINAVFQSGSASSDFRGVMNTFFALDSSIVGADGLTDAQRALQDMAGEVRTAAISAGLEANSMITGQVLSQLYNTAFSANTYGSQGTQTGSTGAKFGFANTMSGFGAPPMAGLVSGQTEGGEVESDGSVWVLGSGTWGDIDPTAVNQGFEYDGQAFELGYTFATDSEFKWGVQGGFGDTDVDTRGTADTVEIDSYNVGVHGSYFSEGFYFNGVGGYVKNDYDSRRDIRFAGLTATGNYDGRELFAYGEVGKIIQLSGDDDEETAMVAPGRNMASGLLLGGMDGHGKADHKGHIDHKRVEEPAVEEEVVEEAPEVVVEESGEGLFVAPLISGHFRHFEQDSYTESGAGPLNLVVRDVELDSFQSGIGARLYKASKTDEGGWIVPELSAKWVHEWGDRDRDVVSSFVGTANTFSIGGVRPSRDSIQTRVGVAAYTAGDWNFDIGYNGEFAGNFENHAGVARATMFFE